MAAIRQPTVTSWTPTATGEPARIYRRLIETPPSGNVLLRNLKSGKSPKVRRPGVKDARGREAKRLGGIYKDRRITVAKRRTPTKATVAPMETTPPAMTKAAIAAVETAPLVTTKVEQQPREAFRGP
jgi:hypothetical protein